MQRLGKGERSADNEGAGACERVDEIARISKGRGRATRGRGERGGGGGLVGQRDEHCTEVAAGSMPDEARRWMRRTETRRARALS